MLISFFYIPQVSFKKQEVDLFEAPFACTTEATCLLQNCGFYQYIA